MIAIIDYGMGNLPNVKRAVEKFTGDVVITSDKAVIEAADKIILPGVGAFGDAMRNIDELGLRKVIIEQAQRKYLLGVCLGMQLLFDESEEDLSQKGLGLIKGKVIKFPGDRGFKVPQIGWNSVKKPKESKILNGLNDGSYFYFVHSYYVAPEEMSVAAGITDYVFPYVSAIESGNIMAAQFHPEKSHDEGLKILENFVNL